GPDRLRQRLWQGGRMRVDQALEQGSERPLGEPAGERIHRHQPPGVDRLVLGVLDDLVVVHAHLERAAPAIGRLDLAVDDEALPAREDAGEVGLAEPDRAEKPGGVSQGDEQRDLGTATRRRAHAGDGPRAGAWLGPHRQSAQRGELAPVLVAIREVHRASATVIKPSFSSNLARWGPTPLT